MLRPWPVALQWFVSPFWSGDYLGVVNFLLAPILEYAVRSSEYRGQTVVVARSSCSTLGGQWRVVTLAVLVCVALLVWIPFTVLCRLLACSDCGGRSLFCLSCSAVITDDLKVL